MVIPTSAVQRGTQGTFVYKVTDTPPAKEDGKGDGKIKQPKTKTKMIKAAEIKNTKYVMVQTVTLGPSEGENVSVTKGVSAGDSLVVDGADSLRDGAEIEIAASDSKPAASPDTVASPDNGSSGKSDKKDDGGSAKPRHKHKKHSDDGDSGK